MRKRLSTFSKVAPIIVGMLLSGCGPAAVPIAAGLITGAAGAGSKILAEKREQGSRETKAQSARTFHKKIEKASEISVRCIDETKEIVNFDASRWLLKLELGDAASISVSQMIDDTKLQSEKEATLLANWSDEIDKCFQPMFSLLESVEQPELAKKAIPVKSYLKKFLFSKSEAIAGYIKGEYTRGDVAQKMAALDTEKIE